MSLKCAVVIPIYRPFLSKEEVSAIKNNARVLADHQIVFIAPQRMQKWVEANEMFADHLVCYFDNAFFISINAYSLLLLNAQFYQSFSTNFTHILIAQTDAWIFRDDLKFFADESISYVGAPCPLSLFYGSPLSKYLPLWLRLVKGIPYLSDRIELVGNGGLSLRRLDSHIKVLQDYPELRDSFIEEMDLDGWIKNRPSLNEDCFWYLVAKRVKDYRIADLRTARAFAWEVNPERQYKRLGRLPMGCHAWQVHSSPFWSKYIHADSLEVR